MKTMKKMIKYLLFCAATLLLAACQHKDLCYDHSHSISLNVTFDWSEAPDARPTSMILYLFPRGEEGALSYEFFNLNGGTISVPVGSYDAICLNTDTESIVYQNTGAYETFEILTQTTDLFTSSITDLGVSSDNAPRAANTEDERVAMTPDMLWTASQENIVFTLSDSEAELTLRPTVSVRTCRVEITEVENLEYVSGLSAVLSTMSGGFLPGSAAYSTEQVTHPFELWAADETTVEGEFFFFHHCIDTQSQHALVVYAVMPDGSKYSYTLDVEEVTSQLHEDTDAYEVVLRLSPLKLPKPMAGDSGFMPSVDEWEEVNIDIYM